jgi:hypothetical protein
MRGFVEKRTGERRKSPVRSGAERRKENIPPPAGITRSGTDRRRRDRRSGLDRRKAH